ERRVARQWLTEAEARSLLAQAAAGLAALHALGIVHRDIKPAHLIVQPGGSGASGSLGSVRLIDFDAARVVAAGAAHDTHRLGTEGYAPPEQFGYGQTDGRSDIYALGVTVRELLGPDFAETSRLGRILARCTEKDPDRRYPDANALAAALQPSRKRTYLRRAAMLSATAVLTLALGGGALLLLTPSGTTPAQELEQTLEDATTKATDEARQVRDAVTGKKTAPPANDADDAKIKKTGNTNSLPGADDASSSAANANDVNHASSTAENASGRLESSLTFNGQPWDAADTIVLSSDDWRTWPREANGATNGDYALFFPSGWQVALTLTNDSDAPLTDASLDVSFDGGSHTETAAIPVSLAPGTTTTVPIALGGRRIDSANMQMATLDLHLVGSTTSISGSKDWVVTFYLQNVGGYHVFDELRSQ
ncbi:MAG: protein kinase, partial [Selenomonas sp.]